MKIKHLKNLKHPWHIQIWRDKEYIDLWSINHLLAGSVIAGISILSAIPLPISAIVLIVLLLLWEVYEAFIGVRETFINRLLDVIIGIIGYGITYTIIYLEIFNPLFTFIVILVCTTLLTTWGAISYKKYNSKHNK